MSMAVTQDVRVENIGQSIVFASYYKFYRTNLLEVVFDETLNKSQQQKIFAEITESFKIFSERTVFYFPVDTSSNSSKWPVMRVDKDNFDNVEKLLKLGFEWFYTSRFFDVTEKDVRRLLATGFRSEIKGLTDIPSFLYPTSLNLVRLSTPELSGDSSKLPYSFKEYVGALNFVAGENIGVKILKRQFRGMEVVAILNFLTDSLARVQDFEEYGSEIFVKFYSRFEPGRDTVIMAEGLLERLVAGDEMYSLRDIRNTPNFIRILNEDEAEHFFRSTKKYPESDRDMFLNFFLQSAPDHYAYSNVVDYYETNFLNTQDNVWASYSENYYGNLNFDEYYSLLLDYVRTDGSVPVDWYINLHI